MTFHPWAIGLATQTGKALGLNRGGEGGLRTPRRAAGLAGAGTRSARARAPAAMSGLRAGDAFDRQCGAQAALSRTVKTPT